MGQFAGGRAGAMAMNPRETPPEADALRAVSFFLAMVFLLTLLMLAAGQLCGCAHVQSVRPMMVSRMVPYHVYCDVAVPEKPHLPIADLKPDAGASENQRAYAESVLILKSAVEQRDTALDSCRRPQ